jgi:hypothetical protein
VAQTEENVAQWSAHGPSSREPRHISDSVLEEPAAA